MIIFNNFGHDYVLEILKKIINSLFYDGKRSASRSDLNFFNFLKRNIYNFDHGQKFEKL